MNSSNVENGCQITAICIIYLYLNSIPLDLMFSSSQRPASVLVPFLNLGLILETAAFSV